jgi:hypothetical protein
VNTEIISVFIRGLIAKFVDSPYCSELGLCGGAVMASFSEYLPWQVMHFLTMFHPLLENVLQIAASFRRIAEQAVLTS